MTTAPRIETERLILRGHIRADFPAYAAMWGDADVTRFIGGVPMKEEEAWVKFLRTIGQWPVLRYGAWVVEDRSSGKLLGEIGFIDAKRDIEPSLEGFPEMGWVFAPDAQGKGFAREAVGAAVTWGDRFFGGVAMRCIIAPENAPSIKLANRVGFAELLRTIYKDRPTIMFERKA